MLFSAWADREPGLDLGACGVDACGIEGFDLDVKSGRGFHDQADVDRFRACGLDQLEFEHYLLIGIERLWHLVVEALLRRPGENLEPRSYLVEEILEGFFAHRVVARRCGGHRQRVRYAREVGLVYDQSLIDG